MLTCSFCGHSNAEDLHFCEKCKTDLTVAVPVLALLADSHCGEMPLSLEPKKSDTDVPTLHFDKIPLVETLGQTADKSDLTVTAPAPSAKPGNLHVDSPAVLDAAAKQSGAGSEPATVLEDAPQAAKPRLVVLRGEKLNMQYTIYPGKNYLGRSDEKPVDIDLENQEPPDRIWTSRQHAVITFENGLLTIEDLNSLNGTFVNRTRVHPGQIRTLQANDIVHLGTVQLRVLLG
jgi:hypothetical protein